jgi:membrane associated rhomboid family serine protease
MVEFFKRLLGLPWDSSHPPRLVDSIKLPVIFVACFWIVELFEYAFDINLNFLGVCPREFGGMIGIFTSPFLHGDFSHLLSNTFPFIILGTGIIFFFPSIAYRVFGLIYLLTGAGVWLMARPYYHIGASGLIYGFAAFLFFSGLFRRNNQYMVLSLIVAILYGGLLYGIFPTHPGVSWESHMIGALTGVYCAYQFRHYETPDEDDNQIDNFIEGHEGYVPMENKRIKYIYREK